MPPAATADTRPLARNGLAVMLAVVILAGALAAEGRGGQIDARSIASLPSVCSTWQPPLRAADGAAAREPFALVLMRGERLPIGSLSAADLQLIDGIGPQRARALIAARRADALGSLEDADRLPGFGPQLVSRLAASVAFPGGRENR